MKLYIVPTPIGNLKDITLRALEVLKSVNYIVCEDTRRTKILLDHYGIKNKKLISCFAPKEEGRIPLILKILEKENVALVVDSGMPGISDPGYKLIRACLEKKRTDVNFGELIGTENEEKVLYKELSHQLVGLIYKVKRELGLGHKENIYLNALETELSNHNLQFLRKPKLEVAYENELIGIYRPDFIVNDKILLEIKALPYLTKQEKKQAWNYLRGTKYKLLLLINFGKEDVQIVRLVHSNKNKISSQNSSQEFLVDNNIRISSRFSSYEFATEDIEIEVLPGPSAFLTALVGSGLPTDKFLFLGFLPKKGLENYFKKYKELEVTVIFYESPYRILKTLDVIEKIFGNIDIVIAREISKVHEEYIRGKLNEVKEKLKIKNLKGEITVILRNY